MVIKQNRPKNGALSIQIVRQRPFQIDVDSHKPREVFALVSPTESFDAIVFRHASFSRAKNPSRINFQLLGLQSKQESACQRSKRQSHATVNFRDPVQK